MSPGIEAHSPVAAVGEGLASSLPRMACLAAAMLQQYQRSVVAVEVGGDRHASRRFDHEVGDERVDDALTVLGRVRIDIGAGWL